MTMQGLAPLIAIILVLQCCSGEMLMPQGEGEEGSGGDEDVMMSINVLTSSAITADDPSITFLAPTTLSYDDSGSLMPYTSVEIQSITSTSFPTLSSSPVLSMSLSSSPLLSISLSFTLPSSDILSPTPLSFVSPSFLIVPSPPMTPSSPVLFSSLVSLSSPMSPSSSIISPMSPSSMMSLSSPVSSSSIILSSLLTPPSSLISSTSSPMAVTSSSFSSFSALSSSVSSAISSSVIPSSDASLQTTPTTSMMTSSPLIITTQIQTALSVSISSATPLQSQTTPPESLIATSTIRSSLSVSHSGQLATPTRSISSSSQSSISVIPSVVFGRIPVVMVTTLNATAVRVTWTPVINSIGYRIFIREISDVRRRKRQAADGEIVITVTGGHVTSRVISGLRPYTSYSVSMAGINASGVDGPRSTPSDPLITDEAAPSSPRNVSWSSISDNQITISWLPPQYPNGIITGYTVVVTITASGEQRMYDVPGNQTHLNISRPSGEFTVIVSAANSAGASLFQNETTTDVPEPTEANGLSPGIIAAIVVFCILLVLVLVAVIVTIAIVWVKRWYKFHGGTDINVDEIEYKAGDMAGVFDTKQEEEDVDGQLTAKRWMRANANYSVPSLLLPPISELMSSSYKTAEDVVEAKTIIRPHPQAVLQTIEESTTPSKEQVPSANSSSERSSGAPSTLSSVCSKEANKVQLQQPPPSSSLPDDIISCAGRDSRLLSDDQALFEMMENVYLVSPQEMDSLKSLELQDPSGIDVMEQVGLGHYTKVMRGVVKTSSPPNLLEGSEIAVRMLKDDLNSKHRDSFLGSAYIISQFSHDNIVSLLCIVTNTIPLMTVFPYASLGDLKHYLTRVRRKTRLESQNFDFGPLQQLWISIQIAAGMEYLASKFFIHRALQAKYILLNEDYSLKIGGFHQSHALAQPGGYFEAKTAGLLPVKWLALETLVNGKFSSNTDIWSFGVVLWEIFSFGLTPFRGVNNDDVLQHLREGKRLNKPVGSPDDIYALMLHCWVETARERPSFTLLHSRLLSHYNDLKKDGINPTKSTAIGGFEPQYSLSSTYSDNYASQTSSTNVDNGCESESNLLDADNSTTVLLPPSNVSKRDSGDHKVGQCDLVLASNGAEHANDSSMELMNAIDNFRHSMGDSNGHELFTKL